MTTSAWRAPAQEEPPPPTVPRALSHLVVGQQAAVTVLELVVLVVVLGAMLTVVLVAQWVARLVATTLYVHFVRRIGQPLAELPLGPPTRDIPSAPTP